VQSTTRNDTGFGSKNFALYRRVRAINLLKYAGIEQLIAALG
jgi:hypothetical protein